MRSSTLPPPRRRDVDAAVDLLNHDVNPAFPSAGPPPPPP
eukprot:gene5976-20223_t